MVNVQKHKLLLSLLLCTITGIFTACTNETESIGNHNGTPLSINVGVDTPQSRAIITGNSLPDGSQIGVSVVDASGSDYQDQNYNNVCYQAVTEDGTQKWKVQSRSEILLSGEAGTLYAYYPWTAAATDFTQIAVNMDEADQKDWMVAESITNLSDAQATAAVKMKHMLTNFKLSFYKDNYSGKGEVTAITIRSNAFATTGTLDVTTGTFTAYGNGHALTRTFTTTLGTDKTAAADCNVMVVPNTVAAPVTISVTVDGNTYSSVTSSLTLEKAKSYNYAMKLSSTGLSITEVTLTDWQTTDLGDTEFKPEQGSVSPWGNIENGIYAISASGEPVAFENANEACVAVAVVMEPHKFMIEKTELYSEETKTFYWGDKLFGIDIEDIYNHTKVGGGSVSNQGYLKGSILSNNYLDWTDGLLSDFEGKANTRHIIDAYDSNSINMDPKDMCYALNVFNATQISAGGKGGWYIPAMGQLALIYVNLEKINETLNKIGGTPIEYTKGPSVYYSSSEVNANNIYFIDFNNGLINPGWSKNRDGGFIRFIRDIE